MSLLGDSPQVNKLALIYRQKSNRLQPGGREIGQANPKAGMKELALKTLNYYKENGIWSATEVKNEEGKVTGYTASQNKLSQEQYDNALNIIQGVNDNGYTPEEQKQYDKKVNDLFSELNNSKK